MIDCKNVSDLTIILLYDLQRIPFHPRQNQNAYQHQQSKQNWLI